MDRKSSCAKNAHEVNGQTHYTEYFNLDVVISVGYRVKSKNGVSFRKWALRVLKEYLLRGYVDNGVLYHLGASLNYAGKKTFVITRLNDEQLITAITNRINAI